MLTGCMSRDSDPFGEPFPPVQQIRCNDDSACTSGTVCTRTHQCVSPDQVFDIHALWTVDGQPPNTASCAALTDLTITFVASHHQLWLPFAPVPCLEGKFTIPRMWREFDLVTLGQGHDPQQAAIDASGVAMIDLLIDLSYEP
jgi:hypothetical protein